MEGSEEERIGFRDRRSVSVITFGSFFGSKGKERRRIAARADCIVMKKEKSLFVYIRTGFFSIYPTDSKIRRMFFVWFFRRVTL